MSQVSKPTWSKKKSKSRQDLYEKGTRLWDLQASTREEMLDWVGYIEHCLSLRRQHLRAQQIAMQAQQMGVGVSGGGLGGSRGPVRRGSHVGNR